MKVTFESKVAVRDWVNDKVLDTVGFEEGVRLMNASTRFSSLHLAAAVRMLPDVDAARFGLPPYTPVTFEFVL